MSDLIDRNAAIEAMDYCDFTKSVNDGVALYKDSVIDALKELPSAQPKRTETQECVYQRTETHDWIPVTDRLPEESKEVLICTDDGLLYIAEHEYLFDRVYWEETTEYRTVENVVAWMPLPEPYKGEEI